MKISRYSKIEIVKPGVILLGFVALSTQIVILREFLTFFNGNEVVIGIILSNWMLLTGLGAYLGRYVGSDRIRMQLILFLLSLLAIIPACTIWVLHFAWTFFFQPGMMAGISHVFFYSIFILSPFCIISGILFTLFAKQESLSFKMNKIGDIYAWESLGSLIGGLILNFILIWVFNTFQSLFLIMFVVSLTTSYLVFKRHYYFSSGILIFITIASIFLFFQNTLNQKIRALAFQGQIVEYTSDSPFGIFAITQHKGQINYYENNILMSSSGDIISKEESVHFAMIQHKNPKNILVLSGFISGVIDEITKYPVSSIDYIDVNPEIIKIARNNLNADSYKLVKLIEQDAIRFLKGNHKKYDVVLINLPEPSTIQLNRYYTLEFFKLLKKNLNPQSVISLSIPASGNYMNEEAKGLISIIYNTLKVEFENVLILPASEEFLLASNEKLTCKIAETIEKINVQTEYVNAYYFDDNLLQFRSEQIMKQLDFNKPVNRDFSPVFYQSQIKLWMSHFNIKYWIPAMVILIFSGFFFFKAGIVYKGVFAAGFAGTSIEIVLMLVFQVLYGYVYAAAGIFIMVFMGGLAYGSLYVPKYLKGINKATFKNLQMAIAVFSFILPLIFMLFKKIQMPDLGLFSIFIVLVLVISTLTGAIFSVACKISKSDYGTIASSAYGMDMIGAATGAILFSIYLIPLLGFGWSVIVVGVFNLILTLTMSLRN